MTDADKPMFLQALARLAVALREKEPDVVTLRIYFEGLRDLEIEFICMAAIRLERESAWFPKVSEWRAMATKVEAERLDAQRALLRTLPEPLCAACSDTGWAAVDGATTRVKPCDCRKLRRYELLGRLPWPVVRELEGMQ